MYDRILVATDGSDSAEHAVDSAIDLATRFDAELFVISVVDTGRYSESVLSDVEPVLKGLEERVDSILESISSGTDLDVLTERRNGRPADEIISFATENDVDLIVMGSSGIGGEQRIGSTVERVIRNSELPTLMT